MDRRTRRTNQRGWWRDGLEGVVWLSAVSGIAFAIAQGMLQPTTWDNIVYAIGRAAGVVAAVLMMAQVLLAARAPWIERAIGHDRAMMSHTRLGKIAITVMLGHFAVITSMTAYYEGRGIFSVAFDWYKVGWFMLLVQFAIVLFALVLVLSITAVRGRWRYENWHAVHLMVYVAIAFAVPHQFLEGSTFREMGVAWYFWAALYLVSFGSFIVYRIMRPLWVLWRHAPRIESVVTLDDGSTSVVVAGRDLDKLRARPGQFFLWRFLAKGYWREAHPYSLSAAPAATLRLTVKPSGDGSNAVRDLKPGTSVMLEGPFGIFTDAARTRRALVLVAAGIGVTPIRSMLEAVPEGTDTTVVLRVRSADEAPLHDEVRDLATTIGANLHVLVGSRGHTWGTDRSPASIAAMVEHPSDTDVFICGPHAWAAQVEEDALNSGIHPEAIHREEFSW